MKNLSIPPITDPLGRHWIQPDLTGLDVDGSYALLSQTQFDMLAEYSTTTPTGVYPGKAWKQHWRVRNAEGQVVYSDRWFLRWFGIVPGNDKVCSNHYLEIIVCH